jgi:hypothetical protein
MKEGPSLFSRAQGGFFAPLKIKNEHYEIRRQGKTKPESSFFENKLKFNLEKREFTRLGLSLAALSLLSLSLFCSFAQINQPSTRTPQQLPIAPRLHQRSTSLHQLICANRSHRLISTLRQCPLS